MIAWLTWTPINIEVGPTMEVEPRQKRNHLDVYDNATKSKNVQPENWAF